MSYCRWCDDVGSVPDWSSLQEGDEWDGNFTVQIEDEFY